MFGRGVVISFGIVSASSVGAGVRTRVHATVSADDDTPIDNPFATSTGLEWMSKWNAPAYHSSGVYVDLGRDTTVDGTVYKEPAGKCPVYGKIIELYQPEGDAWLNDWLQPIPSEAEAANFTPMIGGFASSSTTAAGDLSPVTEEQLKANGFEEDDMLYACAKYAYETRASVGEAVSEYRYPFVWDTQDKKCYILFVTFQKMTGDANCSTNGSPENMAMYCHEPKKTEVSRYIYGSGYVGMDVTASSSKCVRRGVRDGRPGIWEDNKCRELTPVTDGSFGTETTYECYNKMFTMSASDNSTTWSEIEISGATMWPRATGNTKTGGVGSNIAWASHNEEGSSTYTCKVSAEIPDCFEWAKGTFAYHALGGYELECAPYKLVSADDESPQKSEEVTNWDRDVTTRGPWGNEFDRFLFLSIASGIAAAFIIIAAAAAFWHHRTKKRKNARKTSEASVDTETGHATPDKAAEDQGVVTEAAAWGISDNKPHTTPTE